MKYKEKFKTHHKVEVINYLRERAGYETDESFELSQAKRLQEQTADFINKIRGLLEE